MRFLWNKHLRDCIALLAIVLVLSLAGVHVSSQSLEEYESALSQLRSSVDDLLKDGPAAVILEWERIESELIAFGWTLQELQYSEDSSVIKEDPGNLVAYRGRGGEQLLFRTTGAQLGSVWGTDIYTDDSLLAAVAVHAGVLKIGETGVVQVRILPGQDSYEGSTRHGIQSNAFSRWAGSYELVGAQPLARPSDLWAEDAPRNLTGLRGRNQETFLFRLIGSDEGAVWGADIYTDDSRLAVAAVHAGFVSVGETAVITVRILPGQDSYTGTTRNGIVSNSYGRYSGSFEILDAVSVGPIVHSQLQLDPGNLTSLRGKNYEVFRFEVTGSDSGSIWGTDIYTDDSRLAVAVVHAGFAAVGETVVVEVQILPGQDSYEGATRQGVESKRYGRWSGSYTILGRYY